VIDVDRLKIEIHSYLTHHKERPLSPNADVFNPLLRRTAQEKMDLPESLSLSPAQGKPG
jgi:hypothetical protein